jgi:enoyl-CoA hydratase
MSYSTLHTERTAHVLTVTINRPGQLNALSPQVLGELAELFLEPPAGVRGAILTGAGERAFVAGADIKRMAEMTPDEGAAFGRLGQRVMDLIEAFPVPVIACVDGFALGGGCELAMSADFIFATERAVFGQPEVTLGLIPGFGGCVRLPRLVGPALAKELIFTGRNVGSAEALRVGIVNRVFATRDEMLAAAHESLALVAARSPVAVATCKHILRNLAGHTTADQLAAEAAGFQHVFGTEDKREGVAAFIAKRTPRFGGQ